MQARHQICLYQLTTDGQNQVPPYILVFSDNPFYLGVRHNIEENICRYFCYIVSLSWFTSIMEQTRWKT